MSCTLQLPRQLQAGAAALRKRLPVLMIVLLVLFLSGAGRPNPPALASPSSAGALAERFAHSEPGASDDGDNSAIAGRFDFAPRFEALFAASEPQAAAAQSSTSPIIPASPAAVDETAHAHFDEAASESVANAGVVLVRNLPAGSVLSTGTRISQNVWALAAHDVRNVVVTLAPGGRRPVKAEIEVLGRAGTSLARMTVEIREQRSAVARNSRPVEPQRAALRHAPRTTTHRAAKKTGPPAGGASKSRVPQQPVIPPADATVAAAVPPPAKPPFNLQLPFLPGPTDAPAPPAADTVGQQLMINLGVIPRQSPLSTGLNE